MLKQISADYTGCNTRYRESILSQLVATMTNNALLAQHTIDNNDAYWDR